MMGTAEIAAPRFDARRFGKVALETFAAFAAFMLVANLAIVLATAVVRHGTTIGAPASIDGIDHLRVVDDRVWRGSAPADNGYRALAERGVRTVVDLRAERVAVNEDLLRSLGVEYVRIPVRDGQIPTGDQVARFRSVVERSPGLVYLHCMAGVGRTGSMSAAYLVSSGGATAAQALRRNLEIGVPSLEQMAFVAGLDHRGVGSPRPAFVVVSRVLDAPRRIWSYLH